MWPWNGQKLVAMESWSLISHTDCDAGHVMQQQHTHTHTHTYNIFSGKTRDELMINNTVLPAAGSRWPPACTSRRTDPCSRAWGTAWAPRGVGRKRSPRWGPARFRVLLHDHRSKTSRSPPGRVHASLSRCFLVSAGHTGPPPRNCPDRCVLQDPNLSGSATPSFRTGYQAQTAPK